MCTLGVSLNICLKNVYSGSFPEHLSERWVLWMFPFTPLLKMCNLDLPITFFLKMCTLGVSLHTYVKDV